MLHYLFDGTFAGFLTCVFEHYYTCKCTGIYFKNNYQSQFLVEMIQVNTDEMKSNRVYNSIVNKLNKDTVKHIHYAFQADANDAYTLLLKYIELAFKNPHNIDLYHTHPDVLNIHVLSRKVSFEVHRFTGLLRFKDISGFLYAEFTPDHNILEFLADHFLDRLCNEKIIIHDTKRGLALIGYEYKYIIQDFTLKDDLIESKEEILFQNMWKAYTKYMAIEERINKKLQIQMMPKRYWNNLTEMN